MLKSFPKVGKKTEESKSSKFYTEMKKKVKHLYTPNWIFETFICLTLLSFFLFGSFYSYQFPVISIICLTLCQIVSGWLAHSQLHSRNKMLNTLGFFSGTVLAGFSPLWWSRKHNQHHMFTNNMLKDEDIQHEYKKYMFPFLFLKWKLDSLIVAVRRNEIAFVVIHWIIVVNTSVAVYLIS